MQRPLCTTTDFPWQQPATPFQTFREYTVVDSDRTLLLGLCDWGFSSSFFWFAAPPKNNSRAIMSKKSLVKYRSTGSPRFWLVEMSYTQWRYYLKMFKTSIHVTDKSSHGLKISVYLVNTLWMNVSPHSSFHSEQAAFFVLLCCLASPSLRFISAARL